jgi:prepilin signal peptidase PulO-like enzyme (type II secretory pathway)
MSSAFGIGLTTIVGALLGSFTTMLVWRLHHDQKRIFWGRSKCPLCKRKLGPLQLIPLVSWLIQGGKCAFCKGEIPKFYPLTEFVFVTMFFLFSYTFYGTVDFFPVMAIVFFALVLFVYDAKFFEVDRRISIPAILIALVWGFFREIPFPELILGGAIGYLFYAIQYWVSRGKWVGAGDCELGVFMGLVLGWQLLLPALFVAYILGLLVAIPLLISGKAGRKTPLPMGAFLMPAMLLFLLVGNEIVNWYLGMMGSFYL